MVLFHGTDRAFLRSILQVGLQARSGGYLWMAEEPYTSYAFSLRGMDQVDTSDPYRNYGVLLGCEVAGHRKAELPTYQGSQPAHTLSVQEAQGVMIRYVFMIPVRHMFTFAPRAVAIRPAMLKAFALEPFTRRHISTFNSSAVAIRPAMRKVLPPKPITRAVPAFPVDSNSSSQVAWLIFVLAVVIAFLLKVIMMVIERKRALSIIQA